MKLSAYLCLLAFLPVSVMADVVVYTDSQHRPDNGSTNVTVVYLDGPDRLLAQMFGQLSSNTNQAETQAQQVMSSQEWQQAEQQLVASYQQVIKAWQLGIKKIPAVVFNDRDVVYGTTDVVFASTLLGRDGK